MVSYITFIPYVLGYSTWPSLPRIYMRFPQKWTKFLLFYHLLQEKSKNLKAFDLYFLNHVTLVQDSKMTSPRDFPATEWQEWDLPGLTYFALW